MISGKNVDFGNFRWKWCGKDLPLEKLHNVQLNHIKQFIDKKRGTHFGKTSEEWFKAINEVLRVRKVERVLFTYLENTFNQKF